MDPTATFLLLALGVLFLLSGTFSGSETALFSIEPFRIRRFERSASRSERKVAGLARSPERLLAGILFGNTLVNVASSSVAVALARRVLVMDDQTLVVVATMLDTGLLLVLGEVIPKGLAVQRPEMFARAMVWVLDPLLDVLRPFASVLEKVGVRIVRALGVREQGAGGGLSRPELRLLFRESGQQAGLSEAEGTLAANLFDFFETRAEEIMTPRVDVVAVPVEASREELRSRVLAAKHARLPVYRGSLDHVVGFLSTKEFLLEPDRPFEELLKPVYFVPERARIAKLMNEVKAQRLTMMVVVDEYGGTSGILTKEDLLEEIVGEIYDESERDRPAEVVRRGSATWEVDGLVPLDDLAQEIGVPLGPGPAQTVAGHVAHLLGRPPHRNDEVVEGTVRFRVIATVRHRALRLEVHVETAGEEGP